MATTLQRMQAHSGPAIFSYGFRPFFLLGAIWAASVVAVWLPMLGGAFSIPTTFSPLQWHVHELVYGYVPSIVAGFLLTAVPNWTGRLPVTGGPCWRWSPAGPPADGGPAIGSNRCTAGRRRRSYYFFFALLVSSRARLLPAATCAMSSSWLCWCCSPSSTRYRQASLAQSRFQV